MDNIVRDSLDCLARRFYCVPRRERIDSPASLICRSLAGLTFCDGLADGLKPDWPRDPRETRAAR